MSFQLIVWQVFARMFLKSVDTVPVIMQKISFKRATVLTSSSDSKFYVNILKQTGNFEVFESGSLSVTGNIKLLENYKYEKDSFDDNLPEIITRENFYKECRLRRYNYKDQFQSLIEYDLNNQKAKLDWSKKFDCFLDGMLQIGMMIYLKNRYLLLPTFLEKLIIDPAVFLEKASKENGNN